MATKYIENDTDSPIYVGGRMIPPGEGRDVDERMLHPDMREAPAADLGAPEPTLDEQLEQLRLKGVKTITEGLPSFKQEALDRLYELESLGEMPRKTLLASIDAERIRRANALLDQERADQARLNLEEAEAALLEAQKALDAEPDVEKHPALESARAEAVARVDALKAAQA